MRYTLTIVSFALFCLAATSLTGLAQAQPPADNATTQLPVGTIAYEGGDGSSLEKAVVIKHAADEEAGVDAEAAWIAQTHPGWQKGNQALLSENGKSYDRIEYTTPAGTTEVIYFDISDFFGKY